MVGTKGAWSWLSYALSPEERVSLVSRDRVIGLGFEPPRRLLNRAPALFSRPESLPQTLCGTNLLAVFRKP